MSKQSKTCQYEKTIISAMKENSLSNEHRVHINGCSHCRETIDVFSFMHQFDRFARKQTASTKVLPTASDILSRSRSRNSKKQELFKKAMRPIRIFQIAASFIFVTVSVILVSGNTGLFAKLFNKTVEDGSVVGSLSSVLNGLAKSLPFLAVPFALIFITVISYFFYSLFHPENA